MRLAGLIVLAATVFLLSACGRSDEKASSSETATNSSAATDSSTATVIATLDTTTTEQKTTMSEPDESPAEFFERFLGYEINRQYGRSWGILHPGHRAIVSRERYDDCRAGRFERFGSVSGELVSFEVLKVYDDPINAPEIPEKTSKAVTMKFMVRVGAERQTFTDTAHAITVGDRWVWLLSPSDVRDFRAGICPT